MKWRVPKKRSKYILGTKNQLTFHSLINYLKEIFS